MTSQEPCRLVGIVADGGTDRDLIARFVQNILTCGPGTNAGVVPVILKRQKLRDHIEEYWGHASRHNNYSLSSEAARQLVSRVAFTLQGALLDLQSQAPRVLGNHDMIVVNTDAERYLRNAEAYFEDWASIVAKILLIGIERLYHDLVCQGYPDDIIPIVVPLVIFPSSDILVAAARLGVEETFTWHGKPAGELKVALYGTTDLRTLRPEDF